MRGVKDRRAEWLRYVEAHKGQRPDWCECQRCIRELMSNHDSSNRKGNDFLASLMRYDGDGG